MAAGPPQMAKSSPDDFAGIVTAVIAHNDNEIAFKDTGNDTPRYVVNFQKEFRNHHQNVSRGDLVQMGKEAVSDDVFALDGRMEKLEISKRQIGNLYFSQYVMVREGEEVAEGFDIVDDGMPLEAARIRLDAVQKGGGKGLRRFYPGGFEVFGQDRGGGTEIRTDIDERRLSKGIGNGMVVDDGGIVEALEKIIVSWLSIYYNVFVVTLRLVAVEEHQRELQHSHQGEIVEASDGADHADRGRLNFVPEKPLKGERRGDGIRVRINGNQDVILGGKMGVKFLERLFP